MRLTIQLEERAMHLLAPDEGRSGDAPVWQLLFDGIDKGWSEEGTAVASQDSSLPHLCNRVEGLLYNNIRSSLVDEMWESQIKPKIEEFYGQYQSSQEK
ncbi:MAG: hypothetical protein A3F35_02435 [Candidatus Woykebacteria bacterium RIFCSPHIGHO2_12_FULL_45_10]|uniref:Uncharacterized protein n=1 Tax=Candidatus Woykebacteria bacterium RIFCSPHIGHO2_12_FULL_45_10 TaxID=1802603 RepID=A0A1G1WPJ9_9BACT|nr:MAG: hypothetical protein A3F35_02435 [Candidatus Woykebacteria bacterium RIFCSPHIGHO2_12_FULL_45_10]